MEMEWKSYRLTRSIWGGFLKTFAEEEEKELEEIRVYIANIVRKYKKKDTL